MSMVLPALASVFAALCVWLGVRIANRRERWAKWTAVVGVVGAVLYVASFGPACWYAWYCVESTGRAPPPWIGLPYYPLGVLAVSGPTFIAKPLGSYAAARVNKGTHLYLPLRWRKWDISIRR